MRRILIFLTICMSLYGAEAFKVELNFELISLNPGSSVEAFIFHEGEIKDSEDQTIAIGICEGANPKVVASLLLSNLEKMVEHKEFDIDSLLQTIVHLETKYASNIVFSCLKKGGPTHIFSTKSCMACYCYRKTRDSKWMVSLKGLPKVESVMFIGTVGLMTAMSNIFVHFLNTCLPGKDTSKLKNIFEFAQNADEASKAGFACLQNPAGYIGIISRVRID